MMRKLDFILLFFMINNLCTFHGKETDDRSKRGVRVVRKKVRVDTRKETDVADGSDAPREGRHLGLLADLYLRLQCADTSCQARVQTAQLCCVRNFNLNCCHYRHHALPVNHNIFRPLPSITQSIFSVQPAVQPFSVGVSLGLKPSQPFPPVYPFQQDHFLPADNYPHHQDSEDHHHHYNPHNQDHHHGSIRPLHDQDHHGSIRPLHDQDHHGSIRPLHNYKPGLCPHQDEDFYKGPIYHGVQNDIPIVPGSGYGYSPTPTCTYDTDCRGARKCCHVRVSQHRLVMECRYPLEQQHGHGINNWKWRTLETKDETKEKDKDKK